MFYQDDQQLTFTSQIKHELKTTDEIPVYSNSYKYPYVHIDEIQNSKNV